MLNVFYRVLDIGIAALWMVMAVLILRLVFRKASSRVKCAMWGIVALRLLVPVIIESNLAITPYFSVQRIIEKDETLPETQFTENLKDNDVHGKTYTDNRFMDDDRISDFDIEKKNQNDTITVKDGEKLTEYDNKHTFTNGDIRLSNNTISNDPENVKNVQIEMNKVD